MDVDAAFALIEKRPEDGGLRRFGLGLTGDFRPRADGRALSGSAAGFREERSRNVVAECELLGLSCRWQPL
jgi:hypothetical protein